MSSFPHTQKIYIHSDGYYRPSRYVMYNDKRLAPTPEPKTQSYTTHKQWDTPTHNIRPFYEEILRNIGRKNYGTRYNDGTQNVGCNCQKCIYNY